MEVLKFLFYFKIDFFTVYLEGVPDMLIDS